MHVVFLSIRLWLLLPDRLLQAVQLQLFSLAKGGLGALIYV